MITRPTTEQILADCAREVRETLMPAVDGTLKVTLEMLEQVLAQCALRAAHEMAWMAEEIAGIEPYVSEVVATIDAPGVSAALDALRAARTASLHLEDRCAEYHAASEALSCAMEAVLDAGDAALTKRGVALLEVRRDRETELRPNFFFPGRA